MAVDPKRWHEVSRSQFEHERQGLDFLRTNLDGQKTLGVWTNFELVEPGGKLYEIDALVLTTYGLWVLELKDYVGEIVARELSIFRRTSREAPPYSETSPLLSANLKCKVLVSRLQKTRAFAGGRPPFITPLIFLSHPATSIATTPLSNWPSPPART